ncbi:kinase-like domain-containing protein [Hypoxylon sp. FL0543]|nr:kinase-like domain-containing protein [Hypoxylon sp. FL0543]
MDTPKNVFSVIAKRLQLIPQGDRDASKTLNIDDVNEVQQVKFVAQGGYNSIWLVKMHKPVEIDSGGGPAVDQFILRLPLEDTLLPNQITNEVACRRLVAAKLPHLPVPQVYYYQATEDFATSFIVEEFIDAKSLSEQWRYLRPSHQEALVYVLADMILDLAQVQFDMIGGLDPVDMSPAPTVEGCKLFKGRAKFHREECYPIGPYRTTKEYILACYEREIYYYTHASENDIDEDLFTDISVEEFVEELRKKRDALADTDFVDEPFVLVHGDFHGRNILVRGSQVLAVLDWEFAGSYPLSETMSYGDIELIEAKTQTQYEENMAWNIRIRSLIHEKATKRGWDQSKIDLLMGHGNEELGRARREMFPI